MKFEEIKCPKCNSSDINYMDDDGSIFNEYFTAELKCCECETEFTMEASMGFPDYDPETIEIKQKCNHLHKDDPDNALCEDCYPGQNPGHKECEKRSVSPLSLKGSGIKRITVKSTNLKSVGYNKETKTLSIEFLRSKSLYQYNNVPLDLFNKLLKAKSHGRFFNKYIKNSFKYKKL